MIIIMSHLVCVSFKVAKQTELMGPEDVGIYDRGRDFSWTFGLFNPNHHSDTSHSLNIHCNYHMLGESFASIAFIF